MQHKTKTNVRMDIYAPALNKSINMKDNVVDKEALWVVGLSRVDCFTTSKIMRDIAKFWV